MSDPTHDRAGNPTGNEALGIDDLERCFHGGVPAVLATASAAGVPNVTYLSRAFRVDDERIALSNQFFSKSSRNIAENPAASLLLIDPETYDQFRVAIRYERTERRGPLFERLRMEVDALALLMNMQDVFRLRAADIFRVEGIEQLPPHGGPWTGTIGADARTAPSAVGLAELCGRITRCTDLDSVVSVTVAGLAALLGYDHSVLALADETGERLFTIASHGYPDEGVGSEVPVGGGVVGVAAARCMPVRVSAQHQLHKYATTIRRSFEASGEVGPGWEVPLPAFTGIESRIAVPAMALGTLVGVLLVESPRLLAFDDDDEAVLTTVASLVATAVEACRREVVTDTAPVVVDDGDASAVEPAVDAGATTHVRFFAADGSTFLDGDYLIKGVAGRILWSLLRQWTTEGRTAFTNREVRLDPSLDLPDFRDNFESRLILLKRRLDERDAPIRITKTGRGRFQVDVSTTLRLDEQ